MNPLATLLAVTLTASFYSDAFQGKRTANGERFDQGQLTAAVHGYPMGTRLKLTHGGKSVTIRVNDRPAVGNRRIDLSKAAFSALADTRKGVIQVEVKKL